MNDPHEQLAVIRAELAALKQRQADQRRVLRQELDSLQDAINRADLEGARRHLMRARGVIQQHDTP